MRLMHSLNKNKYFLWVNNLYSFASFMNIPQYQSSVYRYKAPLNNGIRQNDKNNQIDLLKSILTRYDIKMPQQTKNDKHLAQALKKIGKFKGDMRLNYKHQLNKLVTQLENNLSDISLSDRLRILRSLSVNLECHSINKKLIDSLVDHIEELELHNQIQLLGSTLHYKRLHHCPQKLFSGQSELCYLILSKMQQTILKSNIIIIKNYKELQKNSEYLSKFAVTSQYISVLVQLVKNQGKNFSIIHLLIDKVLMRNMNDFTMPALLKFLVCIYPAPLNVYQFLNEKDWMIILEHIQSRIQEIKNINKSTLLNSLFSMYANIKIKRDEENQKDCKILLIIVERLIEIETKFQTIRILNKLLTILKAGKNLQVLNRTHDLFFEYLYVTIKEIKIHQYNGKMLLSILTRIKAYKRKYMPKEKHREINNIVTAVSQQLWNKCDDIFQCKDLELKQELYKLIHEKDMQPILKENHKRKGYFIQNLPEQIENKILNLSEQFCQDGSENKKDEDDGNDDDNIY